MPKLIRSNLLLALFLLVGVVAAYVPLDAHAAVVTSWPDVPHGTCTTDPTFTIPVAAPGNGLISSIIVQVQAILSAVSSAMFTNIITDSGFLGALRALVTLYIAFYGIMFTFGMVQITLFDFGIRMIKIGVIVLLGSPSAWSFFNGTFVQFFNAGTDAWINAVSAAVLGSAIPSTAPPFYVIDDALSKAISAKMAVTLMAMFFSPPYGPIIGLLVGLGLGTFIRSVLQAAWVYLMSLILKALLFGIAPIFLSCMLFVRTRYLFEGWLNQVINATLQPILLFTFLAFFVALLNVSIDNLLLTPVCWTEWAESLRGSPFNMHYWRFTLCDTGGFCKPYGGAWSFVGPSDAFATGPIFPIDIIGVLVLVMLADLAARFNTIVISIANDLSAASANLSGGMDSLFGSTKAQAPDGSAAGKALPNEKAGGGGGGKPSGTGGAGKSMVGGRGVPGGKA